MNVKRKDINKIHLEIIRFIFTKDQVYENKKINKKLWYLTTNTEYLYPMINICFDSVSSLMRYLKNNKDIMLNKFGILGENYYIDNLIFSHCVSDADTDADANVNPIL